MSRVSPADPARASPQVFVRGGRNGALLHAPRGIAPHGDTIRVADIDVLRGFNRRTGAPLATIDFSSMGAVLLDDVAVGSDGTLRVTDTGIRMQEGVALPCRRQECSPWDRRTLGWRSVQPVERRNTGVGGRPPCTTPCPPRRAGGAEVLPSGGVLHSSWADLSLHLLAEGRDRRLIVHRLGGGSHR